MPAHSEAKETGERVALGDRAVEIEQCQIHPVTYLSSRDCRRYFTGNRVAINLATSVAAGGSMFASTTTT